jgi:hypothetical protein
MAVIEATIERVEHDQDTGWFTIHTSEGKFSTRIKENADQALSLRSQRVLIDHDEKVVTKPAPDGTPRTYRNRYYNRASLTGPAAAETDGIVQTSSRKTPREDAWRMCLNKGGELAVATLPLMPVEQRDFNTQKQIATAWAKFFFYTPIPDPLPEAMPEPVQLHPVAAAQQAHARGAYDEPPPPGDQDIPF